MIAAAGRILKRPMRAISRHLRFADGRCDGSRGGLACIIHALIPALCTRTCSVTVGRLRTVFDDRRALPTIIAQASGVITFVCLLAFSAIIAAVQFAHGPVLIGPALALLTLGIPAAFLLSNPELEALAN